MMFRRRAIRRRVTTTIGVLTFVAIAPLGCSSSSGRSTDGFCRTYITAADRGAQVARGNPRSVAQLRAAVATTTSEAHTAVDQAPDDVRADAEALLVPLDALHDALEQATTMEQADQAIKAYATATAALVQRQRRVNAWTKANCKVAAIPVPSTTQPTTQPTTGPTG